MAGRALTLRDRRRHSPATSAQCPPTYYWLDPAKRVTALIMTQILPFADPRAVKLYGQFERGVYDALKA